MKTIKITIASLLIMLLTTSIYAQSALHNAKVIDNISIGKNEVTTVQDLETDCIYKSEIHKKGLFVKDEQVQIELDVNSVPTNEHGKIIKPTLPDVVLIHKNGCVERIATNPVNFYCNLPFITKNQISVTNGMLYFETTQAYEKAIEVLNCLLNDNIDANNAWATLGINYNSLYTEAQQLNGPSIAPTVDLADEYLESLGVDDNLLALLLSPTMEIQISNRIYKLDLISETVEVRTVIVATNNGGNANASLAPPPVEIYSTNDDVIDIVNGNIQPGLKGKNCGVDNPEFWQFGDKVLYTVKYQRAAIYFSIVAKLKIKYEAVDNLEISWHGGDDNGGLSTYESWYIRSNKNTREYPKDRFVPGEDKRKIDGRLYAGSRSLKDYHTEISFQCSYLGTVATVMTNECN